MTRWTEAEQRRAMQFALRRRRTTRRLLRLFGVMGFLMVAIWLVLR